MRTIKFRGKRIDMGEYWQYGNLKQTKTRGCFINSQDDKVYGSGVEVDPATVGQFTGFHDKNGVEIYEGDIILHWVSRWPDKKYKGVVIYTDICAAFQYLYANSLNGNSRDFMHQPHGFEVIGNIHEGR